MKSSVAKYLFDSAKRFPDKIAIKLEKESLTYSQLLQKSLSVREFLLERSKPQEIVAMCFDNSIDFVISYFGIISSRRICVILNPLSSTENLRFIYKKTSPKLTIADSKYSSKLKAFDSWHVYDIASIPNRKVQVSGGLPVPSDIASIIFTSGTTGEPKGVVLRHQNIEAATTNMSSYLKVSSKDKCLIFLPLYHSFGLGNIHMHFKRGGSCVILKNSINIPKIFFTVKRERITNFSAVPSTLTLVSQHFLPEFKKVDKILRFIVTNTTHVPVSTIDSLMGILSHTRFYCYYGLTEASRSTFICYNDNLEKKLSVGRPLRGVGIKIVNGEILIKGRHVASGYYRDEEASRSFKKGWLCTGDVGYLDKDGFLFLLGRKDEILNISGDKVSPIEIERVIIDSGYVKEVAILGKKDRILGTKIIAFVVPKVKKLTKEKLVSFCLRNLERYKVPSEIRFIDFLPKTESGKPRRIELLKLI